MCKIAPCKGKYSLWIYPRCLGATSHTAAFLICLVNAPDKTWSHVSYFSVCFQRSLLTNFINAAVTYRPLKLVWFQIKTYKNLVCYRPPLTQVNNNNKVVCAEETHLHCHQSLTGWQLYQEYNILLIINRYFINNLTFMSTYICCSTLYRICLCIRRDWRWHFMQVSSFAH